MVSNLIPLRQRCRRPHSPEKTLTIKEYGKKYGYSVHGVRYLLRTGHARGYKVKGVWRVWNVPPGRLLLRS